MVEFEMARELLAGGGLLGIFISAFVIFIFYRYIFGISTGFFRFYIWMSILQFAIALGLYMAGILQQIAAQTTMFSALLLLSLISILPGYIAARIMKLERTKPKMLKFLKNNAIALSVATFIGVNWVVVLAWLTALFY